MDITLSFVWENRNPLHIYDCTDKQLESVLMRLAEKTMLGSLPFDKDRMTGFIHEDFIDRQGECSVNVKSRECGLHGKPLNFWQRLRYLLTGRYWR